MTAANFDRPLFAEIRKTSANAVACEMTSLRDSGGNYFGRAGNYFRFFDRRAGIRRESSPRAHVAKLAANALALDNESINTAISQEDPCHVRFPSYIPSGCE
jgi:hypothetical protein